MIALSIDHNRTVNPLAMPPYLHNLLCSVERVAPATPWFVIAMDNETCSGAEHCTYPYRQASLASGAR